MIQISPSGLRKQLQGSIAHLADQIEVTWHHCLDLSPYTMPENFGYIEGQLEEGMLVIENRCYQTPQFRKLHLELARVGTQLDILHCVMFPRSTYPLPMFGADLVAGPRGISAAIVDLSPMTTDRALSETYAKRLANLPDLKFAEPRELPTWGDIFSPFCLFVRPVNAQEEKAFVDRVIAMLTLHCEAAIVAQPVTTPEAEAEIVARQRYYCQKQKQNDKTRRVLQKAFGEEWTDRYINQVLFDCD